MKKWVRRIIEIILIFGCVNVVSLVTGGMTSLPARILYCTAVLIGFLLLFFAPYYEKKVPLRLQFMMGGYELLVSIIWVTFVELLYDMYLWKAYRPQYGLPLYIAHLILSILLLFLLVINGIARIMITSKQGKILHKIVLFFFWWMPVLNIYCMVCLARSVRREYYLEKGKLELNAVRAENQVCHTRYPIVMVHGVFFRDWQLFNYWGRIPGELMKNGAVVYYGKQQSAATIADSAQELKEQIVSIIENTHCEKVNIIAHSKGGLDSRYAISCLGLAPYVASLTTINTPHYGCEWAEVILHKVSDSLVQFVAKRYAKIFTVLGDKKPDFSSAVWDLTTTRCQQLNEEAPDVDAVYYQSVMSIMKYHGSDSFPLNRSHYIVQKVEGANDGLVSANAGKWGHFQGVLQASGKRGISHGDMIDLRRENIRGFDVREYYVNLVKQLKEQGF